MNTDLLNSETIQINLSSELEEFNNEILNNLKILGNILKKELLPP